MRTRHAWILVGYLAAAVPIGASAGSDTTPARAQVATEANAQVWRLAAKTGDDDDIDDLIIERARRKAERAKSGGGRGASETEDDLYVGRQPAASSPAPVASAATPAPAIARRNCGTHWTGWHPPTEAKTNPCPAGCEPGDRLQEKRHGTGASIVVDAQYQCHFAPSASRDVALQGRPVRDAQPPHEAAGTVTPDAGRWNSRVIVRGPGFGRAERVAVTWYPNDNAAQPPGGTASATLRRRIGNDEFEMEVPSGAGGAIGAVLRVLVFLPGQLQPMSAGRFTVSDGASPPGAGATGPVAAPPCRLAAALPPAFDEMKSITARQYASLIQQAPGAQGAALAAQRDQLLSELERLKQRNLQTACGPQETASPAPPAAQPVLTATPVEMPLTRASLPLTLSPNSMPQGQASPSVTVTGQNTSFEQGRTTARLAVPGSTATVTVTSATSASVQLTLPNGVPTGRYTLSLATGPVIADAVVGFLVTPLPDAHGNHCAAATELGNVGPGTQFVRTGILEQAATTDWFRVSVAAGTALTFTLSGSDPAATALQMRAFRDCTGADAQDATDGGSGAKILSVSAGGPRTVLFRVSASRWALTHPAYRLSVEGR